MSSRSLPVQTRQLLLELRDSGMSYADMVKTLHEQGVKTARGLEWTVASLKTFFSRENKAQIETTAKPSGKFEPKGLPQEGDPIYFDAGEDNDGDVADDDARPFGEFPLPGILKNDEETRQTLAFGKLYQDARGHQFLLPWRAISVREDNIIEVRGLFGPILAGVIAIEPDTIIKRLAEVLAQDVEADLDALQKATCPDCGAQRCKHDTKQRAIIRKAVHRLVGELAVQLQATAALLQQRASVEEL